MVELLAIKGDVGEKGGGDVSIQNYFVLKLPCIKKAA